MDFFIIKVFLYINTSHEPFFRWALRDIVFPSNHSLPHSSHLTWTHVLCRSYLHIRKNSLPLITTLLQVILFLIKVLLTHFVLLPLSYDVFLSIFFPLLHNCSALLLSFLLFKFFIRWFLIELSHPILLFLFNSLQLVDFILI